MIGGQGSGIGERGSGVGDRAAVVSGSSRKPRASFMTGARRVFELSLGEMLWSRRTIFMLLVVGGPVILAVVARFVQASGIAPLRVNGARVDGAGIFGMMLWIFFLRFIVPVLGVFYGTSLIADEVEDRTITYLFTRPIRRGAVLVGKYLAYLVCTTLVVLPSVVLVYFLIVPFSGIAASFAAFATDLGLLAIGLAVYGAVFALVGVVLKRPLVSGLVFAFGWEQLALIVPGYLRKLTVAHYLQALVPHAVPSEGVASVLRSISPSSPSAAASLLSLAVILGLALVAAARTIERREYVLDQ